MMIAGSFNPQAASPSDDGYSPPSAGYYMTTITKDTKDYVTPEGRCTSFQLWCEIDPAHRNAEDSGHKLSGFINYFEKDSETVLSAALCKVLSVATGTPEAQIKAGGFQGDPIAVLVGKQIPVYWAPKARPYNDKKTGEAKLGDDFRVISREGFAARRNAWLAEHNKGKAGGAAAGGAQFGGGGGGAAAPAGGFQQQAPAQGGFQQQQGGFQQQAPAGGFQQQAAPANGFQQAPANGFQQQGNPGFQQGGGFPGAGGGFPNA